MGLWVQLFDLVLDSVMDAVVKHLENIIFFLNIGPNVFIVFFLDEFFPMFQPREFLLVVHLSLEPFKHVQELSDKKIPNSICYLNLFPSIHGLLSNCGQKDVNVSSVQNVGAVSLKGLDLLFSFSLLILDDVLFAFGLSSALDFRFHVYRFFSLVLAFDKVAVEFLFGFFVDNIVCIVVNVLLFLNFLWMVNDHVGF